MKMGSRRSIGSDMIEKSIRGICYNRLFQKDQYITTSISSNVQEVITLNFGISTDPEFSNDNFLDWFFDDSNGWTGLDMSLQLLQLPRICILAARDAFALSLGEMFRK